MILSIDTTDNLKTIIKLGDFSISKSYSHPSSQEVLILIDKLIKKSGIKLIQITAIKVNNKLGSYTGTRVGVAIANALGWGLGLKVNGKRSEDIIYPVIPK